MSPDAPSAPSRSRRHGRPTSLLLTAAGAADAAGLRLRPATLLVETGGGGLRILAAGSPGEVASHPGASAAERIDLPRDILLPAFVNAHAHLDLTSVGPRPFGHDQGQTFGDWLGSILRDRPVEPEALYASMRLGVAKSLAGGVVAVGDIAGATRIEPILALQDSPLRGTAFLEVFGLADRQQPAADHAARLLDTLDLANTRMRAGLTPHAPYSVGPDLYARCAAIASERNIPLCTHLAESLEERTLIAESRGGFIELLTRMGMWSPIARTHFGAGRTPVAHLESTLRARPFLIAHANDVSDGDIALLAETGASVAYCPRSCYDFQRERDLGPHRFNDMLDRGLNVCLGTDSIVNLPPAQADRISPLDDARFLLERGRASPARLLEMLTVRGARALGVDESLVTLAPGPVAGLVAIRAGDVVGEGDPAAAALRSASPPRLLAFDADPAPVVADELLGPA